MSRKFIGYMAYEMEDFSIFGGDEEASTKKVVAKSVQMARKHPNLYYDVIQDSPLRVVVFATQPFRTEEAENWYEKTSSEEEAFVYDKLSRWLQDAEGASNIPSIHDVLEESIEEFIWEKEDVQLIFRYDRILVVSSDCSFRTFSIRSDKLFRWFFND